MAQASSTGRIITTVARAALAPPGLVQKGRSRTWLDDRGWWLGVVEFQPSSWDRGTYLNVGVHLLWDVRDYIAFDWGGGRLKTDAYTGNFIPFRDAEGFESATRVPATTKAHAGLTFGVSQHRPIQGGNTKALTPSATSRASHRRAAEGV